MSRLQQRAPARTQPVAAGQGPSSTDPTAQATAKELETLRKQVMDLAQQNVDLTKIITQLLAKQESK